MAASTEPDARGGRLGYLPGVDGLRAVAVSAVFLFHADVVPGGFLGVDVFFVISGFLITALAIGEIERTGTFSLGRFWGRRARRLLPALYLLVAAVVVWALIDGVPDGLGRDVVATLAYVANWVRVGDGYEYFAAYEDPSLLEHAWSLAVEEQFYLVWPVVIVIVLAATRSRSWSPRVTIGAVAAVGALASTAWSWWLAQSGGATLNRLYFGTDTRAVGLAVGCVAGCVLARGVDTGNRRIGLPATIAAVVGLAVLTVMTFRVDGSEVWLYGPGFAVAAAASLALVHAAAGEGPVRRVLSVAPLAAMGRVSYGIYLWHWPVIVVLDTERTGLSGPPLGLLWVSATAALTAASWYLIEVRAPLPTMLRPMYGATYAVTACALALLAVGVTRIDRADDTVLAASPPTTTVTAPATAAEPVADANEPPQPSADVEPAVSTGPAAGDESGGAAVNPVPDESADGAPTEPEARLRRVPADRPLQMLVLGDSIAESLKVPDTPELNGVAIEVVNRSIIACPVTWEGRWAFDDGRLVGDPPECDSQDRFSTDVAEAEADVILLMFGWSGTIAGRELDDGTIVAPCEPGFDDQYADEMQRLVDRFTTDETVVVVATVAPPTEYRDPEQSDRPGCLNDVIRAGDHPVYEFGEWLCPGADCTWALPLMRDTVHFHDSPDIRAIAWPAIVDGVLSAGGY